MRVTPIQDIEKVPELREEDMKPKKPETDTFTELTGRCNCGHSIELAHSLLCFQRDLTGEAFLDAHFWLECDVCGLDCKMMGPSMYKRWYDSIFDGEGDEQEPA